MEMDEKGRQHHIRAISAGLPWATSASISASLPLPLRSLSVQPSRRRLLV
jgi:hypothetical protein